jgi:N4-gp56 family major capsid protein
MSDAFTDITSGTSLGVELVQQAFDRFVEFALRAQPQYRSVVDKRPAQQAMPGSSVVFNIYADLSPSTATLTETTDPDAVAIPQTSPVTVTLQEYGMASLVTRKLRLLSLSDVDPGIADIIAFNMLDSMDILVRDTALGGTNAIRVNGTSVLINSGTTGAVEDGDIMESAVGRATVAVLRNRKAMPRVDNLYVAYVNPDVSYDLRSETGTSQATWRTPHEYSAAGNIWGGTIGEYEGILYVETPRTFFADDGDTSETVHRSLVFGRQAIAEAVAEEPGVRIGPVTDKLMRFRPIGWYGLLGWNIYRDECIVRWETASSINTTSL